MSKLNTVTEIWFVVWSILTVISIYSGIAIVHDNIFGIIFVGAVMSSIAVTPNVIMRYVQKNNLKKSRLLR